MRNFAETGLSARKKNWARGMTLVELLVSIAAGMLVLVVVAKLTLFTARSFVALGNYNDLDRKSVFAVDTMSREIRQTLNVSSFQTNRVSFTDYDGILLSYSWNPVTHKLTRTKNSRTRELLKQCDYLNFKAFQQNPTNDFTFVETTNNSQIKLIDVSWRCSRQILRKDVNTESVQTARIVIRN